MTPKLEAMFEHAPMLRRLARSLCRDEASADDLVQETWIAAVERPERAASLRWLTGWMRSRAYGSSRSARRRAQREREGSGRGFHEEDRSLEVAEEVLAAMRRLPEGLRRVLWLRYYEERSTAQIASSMGIEPRAVETRLRRARAALREDLGRRYPDGQWRAALLGFARVAPEAAGLGLGLLGLGLAGAVLLGLGSVALWRASGESGAAIQLGDQPAPAGQLPLAQAELELPPSEARQPIAKVLLESAPEKEPEAAPAYVPNLIRDSRLSHGRVLDHEGHPVVGMTVGSFPWDAARMAPAESGHPTATTGSDGRFSLFTYLNPRCWIVTGSPSPAWAIIQHDTDSSEVLLTLPAPQPVLDGRVLDHLGRALPGQRVDGQRFSEKPRMEFGGIEFLWSEDRIERRSAFAWTDEEGRYALLGLAPGQAQLEVSMVWDAGWSETVLPIPPVLQNDSSLALQPMRVQLPSAALDVRGLWACRLGVLADGEPAPAAQLLFEHEAGALERLAGGPPQGQPGIEIARLDQAGRAVLSCRVDPTTHRIEVRVPGFEPRLLRLADLLTTLDGPALIEFARR